jgi:mannose-1-phosphate guanylyltransferase/mannose-1-phosphate guanylyltransferase/mannose-6-phosphate isomerase
MQDLSHYEKDIRPWGNYERFTLNENSTVKVITVHPHQAFSLQTHAHRSEFWYILSGDGTITIADEKKDAKPGETFYIHEGVAHRAEAGAQELRFLEIAFGSFDESDITRLEDLYGRA